MSCVEACPEKGALGMRSTGFGRKFWTPSAAGVCIALFFVLTVGVASISGKWRGTISDHEFSTRIKTIDAPETTHPAIFVPERHESADVRLR